LLSGDEKWALQSQSTIAKPRTVPRDGLVLSFEQPKEVAMLTIIWDEMHGGNANHIAVNCLSKGVHHRLRIQTRRTGRTEKIRAAPGVFGEFIEKRDLLDTCQH
jgi:hypothetical protein